MRKAVNGRCWGLSGTLAGVAFMGGLVGRQGLSVVLGRFSGRGNQCGDGGGHTVIM